MNKSQKMLLLGVVIGAGVATIVQKNRAMGDGK